MALGDENAPVQGQSDHVIGAGHKGRRREQTARLMTSSGESVLVNTYEFAENAGKPNSKISPEEGGSLDQLTQDLQICLSSVLDEKTWWSIPRKGKPAWILPRASWDRMQQSLIDRLNPDHDGPLNKDLFNEPSIASLFPSTEEMPLTLAD